MAHGPLARSRTQCAVQKAAEKCINTHNGENKKIHIILVVELAYIRTTGYFFPAELHNHKL